MAGILIIVIGFKPSITSARSGCYIVRNHVFICYCTIAAGRSLNNAFLINSIEYRFTDFGIGKNTIVRRGLIVDAEKLNIVRLCQCATSLGRGFNVLPLGQGRIHEIVKLTILICDDCRSVLGDKTVFNIFDCRCALPIIFIGLQLHAGGNIILRYVIRSRSRCMRPGSKGNPAINDFLIFSLAVNFNGKKGVRDGRIGIFERHDYSFVTVCLDRVDHRGHITEFRILHCQLIAEYDVLCRKRISVLEGGIHKLDGIGKTIFTDLNILCQ